MKTTELILLNCPQPSVKRNKDSIEPKKVDSPTYEEEGQHDDSKVRESFRNLIHFVAKFFKSLVVNCNHCEFAKCFACHEEQFNAVYLAIEPNSGQNQSQQDFANAS